MNPSDIAHGYDQLAELWNTYGLSRNGIAQRKRAIAFLQKKRYALDIACGSSGRFDDAVLFQRATAFGMCLWRTRNRFR